MRRSTTLAVLILATALSASVLVLLLPGFFDGRPCPGWLVWPLVGVLAASGAGVLLVRHRR